MARNGDQLPRWSQIIIAAFIVGVFIWALVPKRIIWLTVAVAIAILGVVSYLAYKRQGIAAFTTFAKRAYNWLVGTQKSSQTEIRPEPDRPEIAPTLSPDEKSLLIVTVGSACENPRCQSQFNPEVHHIQPRAEGGSNSVWNLIVLCHGCHGHAGRKAWPRPLLKQWTNKHGFERKRLLDSGQWKHH